MWVIFNQRRILKLKIRFRDNDFEVDREVNKRIYGGLNSDTDDQRHDSIVKFYLSNRDKLFSSELVDFLNSAGVDLTKENEIFHYKADDHQVIIEGWYDVVGKVLTNEKVVSFYYLVDDQYTINVFFGNESRHGIRPEFSDHETFRFDFSIVVHNNAALGQRTRTTELT